MKSLDPLFKFTKMHGLGNDFVVIDSLTLQKAFVLTEDLSRQICDRHFGIGADQILWLVGPQSAGHVDARMEIRNPDGSIAEMCGNGIRAAALYLYRHGPKPKQCHYEIETLGGLKKIEIKGGDTELPLMTVDMGSPILGAKVLSGGEELQVAGQKIKFFEVGMGNPHAVIYTDDIEKIKLGEIGPEIERHSRFPKRTNVEFVQVVSPSEIRVRVWERGTGITLACGTGACASAVATLATDQGKGTLTVRLPGGDLQIAWAGGAAPVMMTGTAVEVYSGEWG